MEVVASLVAGAFALITAYLAWQLRESEKKIARLTERKKEKEEFYKKIHRTFDGGIQAIKRYKATSVQKDFIELNAEVALLASDELGALYEEAAQRLEEWSYIFPMAWPNTDLIQMPDPAAKHKLPERTAYQQLIKELYKLNAFMKADLKEKT